MFRKFVFAEDRLQVSQPLAGESEAFHGGLLIQIWDELGIEPEDRAWSRIVCGELHGSDAAFVATLYTPVDAELEGYVIGALTSWVAERGAVLKVTQVSG